MPALGHAVAVADLRVVRQVARPTSGRRPRASRKQQLGAVLGQRRRAVEGLQERRRAVGVAEQDRAGQPAVADDQLLVDAARRLRRSCTTSSLGVAGSLSPITARSTPMTLSLVETLEPAIRRRACSRPVSRSASTCGLLPERRDQAVDLAAVLRALADREDRRVARASAGRRRRRCRARPSGRRPAPAATFGRMPAEITTMSQSSVVAVVEQQAGDVRVAEHRAGRAAARCVVHAHPLHRRAQHARRPLVELHLHQVRASGARRGPRRPSFSRPRAASRPSRPPPMTAARASARGVVADGRAVVQRAEDEHAVAIAARVGHAGPRAAARTACCRWRSPARRTARRRRRRRSPAARSRSMRVTRTPACSRTSFCVVPGERVDEDVLARRACRRARPTAGCGCSCRTARRRTSTMSNARGRRARGRPRPGARRPCRCRSPPAAVRVFIVVPSVRRALTRAAHTLNSGIRLIGSSAGLVSRFADCSPPQ